MKIIVAAGLLLAASFAHAQTSSFEFKGITLDSDVASITTIERFFCRKTSSPIADRACSLRNADGETIAGVPVEDLTLFFFDEKLHTITISFASKDFDEVASALKEKYGKAVPETEAIQNRMGATFSNETYSWRKPGQVLRVEKYASDINSSRATFQTDAGLDEFSRRADSQKKANARDL